MVGQNALGHDGGVDMRGTTIVATISVAGGLAFWCYLLLNSGGMASEENSPLPDISQSQRPPGHRATESHGSNDRGAVTVGTVSLKAEETTKALAPPLLTKEELKRRRDIKFELFHVLGKRNC